MGCVWIVRLCYCGFGLAGATLSPTRISRRPDQTGNLHSVVHEKGILLTRIRRHPRLCVLFFFFQSGRSEKSFPFFPISAVFVPFISTLLCVFLKSMICCVWPRRVAPQSSHPHPFYPRVLKWIALQCVAALGFQPAVFDISSTCWASGSWTGNLCPVIITDPFPPQTLNKTPFSFQRVLCYLTLLLSFSFIQYENSLYKYCWSAVEYVLFSASGLCTSWCVTQQCALSRGALQRMAWSPPSRSAIWVTSCLSSAYRRCCAAQLLPVLW